jgi:hypothetical protein
MVEERNNIFEFGFGFGKKDGIDVVEARIADGIEMIVEAR